MARKYIKKVANKGWFKKDQAAWNKNVVGLKRPGSEAEKNWHWKGDKVGYIALHEWVAKQLGKPNLCEMCDTTTAKRFEWSNKSGLYLRDITDWQRLCTSCHRKYDNIIRNLHVLH